MLRCSVGVGVRVKYLFAAVAMLTACLSLACEREGALRIHHVQGIEDASPYEGDRISLDGVAVTAIGERGFFVQEPEHRTDDDARTSEGLYVYGNVPSALEVGDRLALQGRVIEFHGHTQLKPDGNVRILGPGETPAATLLRGEPKVSLEALESMRVSVPEGLVVSPTDEHGVVSIATDGNRPVRSADARELTPLPEMDPAGLGGAEYRLASPRPFSADGVLVYRYGDFVLWPTRLELGEPPALPRPVRDARRGELALASYNLRLFFDETGVSDEPVAEAGSFRRRLDKHAGWLGRVLRCPDVVAVQEVEAPSVLSRLAGESGCGYRAFAGEKHSDLALGYLLGPEVELEVGVRPVGVRARMPGTGRRLFDRPPLKAVIRTPDGPLTLFNVHLRSMRGLGREPRVTVKRRAQADALNDLVNEARARGERVVVLGDFNALPFDDGHVDVLGRVAAGDGSDHLAQAWQRLPPAERYSYLYRGHGQMLDHALIDPALAGRVTDVLFARGNADAPVVLGREEGTLLRASDHDPFVLYLRNSRQPGNR